MREKKTISIKIDPKTGLAIATCTGILNLDDAKQGAIALWKTVGWPGELVVWDFREATFDISSEDVQYIAQFIFSHQPEKPPSKVAFVTSRDADFGMARVFEVYRQDLRTMFRVFRNFDEALAWAKSV